MIQKWSKNLVLEVLPLTNPKNVFIFVLSNIESNESSPRAASPQPTNSSFGVDYGNPNNYPIWCSMYDEMGNVGILSCGAGPNMNVNVDVVGDVPSTCPGEYLIGVTNTTSADVKYSSAGYGINNIDIGAPDTSIYSTKKCSKTKPYNLPTGSTGNSSVAITKLAPQDTFPN